MLELSPSATYMSAALSLSVTARASTRFEFGCTSVALPSLEPHHFPAGLNDVGPLR